jgi:hypothetical protein
VAPGFAFIYSIEWYGGARALSMFTDSRFHMQLLV